MQQQPVLVALDDQRLDPYLPGMTRPQKEYLCRERILPDGPGGVVVRLGRRVFINLQRLEEFVANGGSALPGGWKRDAEEVSA